jgi:MOSC domain-containing protein YiiM
MTPILETTEYEPRFAAIRYETIGWVQDLIVSVKHDEHVSRPEIRVVPGMGVEGDHRWKQWWRGERVPGRQISAMNAEVLDALDVPYDVPGDNLIIRGFDLASLEPGDMIRVGSAVLAVTPTMHRPCAIFAQRTSPEKKQAISPGRRRGTLLDAVNDSIIRIGDPVERIVTKSSEITK